MALASQSPAPYVTVTDVDSDGQPLGDTFFRPADPFQRFVKCIRIDSANMKALGCCHLKETPKTRLPGCIHKFQQVRAIFRFLNRL